MIKSVHDWHVQYLQNGQSFGYPQLLVVLLVKKQMETMRVPDFSCLGGFSFSSRGLNRIQPFLYPVDRVHVA
jgi:hypothetical protein